MLIQPIIGNASDRTWGRLGRRRPYFLAGAILSSLMLILMPNASALWMAAGMLWILDASINVSMEPFRAFVADILPEGQRTSGLPCRACSSAWARWWLPRCPGCSPMVFTCTRRSEIRAPFLPSPDFRSTSAPQRSLERVMWTIVTTKEYPPEDLEAFRRAKAQKTGIAANAKDILSAIAEMPDTMRKLGPVQLCTWLGLFCMWLYFPVAVAHNIFGADDPGSPQYQAGVEWGGNCFAVYSLVCFAFSFALPGLARRLGRKYTHTICLLCGAAGPDVGDDDPQQVRAAADDGGRRHRLGKHAVHALRGAGGIVAAGAHRRLHGHLQLLHRHAGDPGVAVLRVDHDPSAATTIASTRWWPAECS